MPAEGRGLPLRPCVNPAILLSFVNSVEKALAPNVLPAHSCFLGCCLKKVALWLGIPLAAQCVNMCIGSSQEFSFNTLYVIRPSFETALPGTQRNKKYEAVLQLVRAAWGFSVCTFLVQNRYASCAVDA